MKQLYLSFCLTLFTVSALLAQKNCCDAEPLQGMQSVIVASNSGNGSLEELSECSCLAGDEHDAHWFTFECLTSGTFEMMITPLGFAADYDFALYGAECPCSSKTTVVSCDYTGPITPPGPFVPTGIASDPLGTFGVPGLTEFRPTVNLVAGTTYFIVADNITSNGVGFKMDFSGTAVIGPAPPPPAPNILPIAGADSFCKGDTIMLISGTHPSGGELTWTVNIMGVSFVDDDNTGDTVQITTISPGGTVQVCAELTSPCFPMQHACKDIVITFPETPVIEGFKCPGEPFLGPGGILIYTPGWHVIELTTPEGCDSTVYVDLTWIPESETSFSAQFCEGGSYEWNGQVYTQSGIYQQVFNNWAGCDSTVTLDLAAVPNQAVIGMSGGLDCISGTVVLDGFGSLPGFGLQYEWSNQAGQSFSNAPLISVTTPGTYHLTTTFFLPNYTCTDETSIVVEVDNAPPGNVTATGGTLTCTNTTVHLEGNTTSGGVTFSWTGPNGFTSTLQDPFVSVPGNYVLTVTGSNGCKATATAVVANNTSPPNISAAGGEINCSTGSLALTGNSTTPGVSYTWTGPGGFTSNQQNPTISSPGNYVLTVTAPNGCTSQATAAVLQNTSAPNASGTGGILTCGTSTLTLQGNSTTPGVSFSWTGPGGFTSNLQNPTVSASGTYTLTVSAPNGCTATATATVQQDNSLPNVSATGGTITCANASLTLQGGSTTPGVSYAWTGPGGFTSSLQNPVVSAAGQYSLTVTAPNGCSASAQAQVSQDAGTPNVSATGGLIDCGNANVVLQGSSNTPGAIFSWTGPGGFTSNQPTPTVSMPGTYVLTVSAANGCTASSSATVQQDLTLLAPSASGGTLTCSTISLTLQGGSNTPGVTFAWTGPGGFSSTVQNPIVSAPGTYVLTITSSSGGCTATATATVQQDLAQPNASASGGTLTCTSGSLILQGGSSTPGVTFEWMGPGGFSSTSQNPTVSQTGTYTLTVLASNGCTATANATVQQDAGVPDVSASGGTLDCNVSSVQLDGESTTPGVNFSWTGPGGFSSNQTDPTVTQPGTYVLLVTAANNCTAQASAVVVLDNQPPDAQAVGGELTCAAASVSLSGSSATPGASLLWNGPGGFNSTSPTPSVTQPGNYVLTVSTPNGCTATATAVVSQDSDLPNVSASGGTITCNISSIVLNGSSTTAGVVYQWSGPGGFSSNQEDPTATQPGNYSLTVTAANGCSASISTIVSENTQVPDAQAAGGILSCASASLNLSGNSATSSVNYSWTGPGGFVSNQQNPVVSQAGNYVLTVTAGNGCTATASATVQQDTGVPDASAIGGTITCEQTDVQLTGNSGTPGVGYAWTGPGGFSSDEQNPTVSTPGNYVLTVTAGNGCSTSAQAVVAEDATPPDAAATGGTLTCTTGNLTLTGNSGTAGVSYSWSGPGGFTSDQQNPVVSAAGNYVLTVTAANGCTATASAAVATDAGTPDVSATGGTINCNSPNLTLNGGSNTPDVDFSWAGPGGFTSNEQNPQVATAGLYTLTVTAPNGCIASAYANVEGDFAVPDVTASGGVIDCQNSSLTLSGISGTPDVDFSWTGPGSFISDQANPTTSLAGSYTLTVTAPNGCSASAGATVTLDAAVPIVSASGGTLTCEVLEIQLQSTVNTSDVTYAWTGPGGFTSDQANPAATEPGTYSLTVTAPNGCSATAQTTVTEDLVEPTVQILEPDQLDCVIKTVTLDGSGSSAGSSFEFQWITAGGHFVSGGNTLNPQADAPGTYTLEILNLSNGCTASASVEVHLSDAVPSGVAVASDPVCFGESTGFIVVETVQGGTPPFLYSINDGDFGDASEFPNLLAGEYSVTIKDATGCTWETSFTLTDPLQAIVSLGAIDLDLAAGEHLALGNSVELKASVPLPADLIASVTWEPQGTDAACPGCLQFTVSPLETTTYTVTVSDPNGCTGSDELTIPVLKNRPVFVPNAFSPNGDGVNDWLTVFGGASVTKVKSFLVLSRWGETVFQFHDFDPNNPSVGGWDGMHRGELLDPAVFAWFAEIEFVDGTVEIFEGDVTLMR